MLSKRSVSVVIFCCTVIPLLLAGCGGRGEKEGRDKSVVIAGEGDVDSFNPLFAQELTAGELNDLMFPSLLRSEFDTARGVLIFIPSLAKSWEFSTDKKDITFHLKTSARWSDGPRVTSRDVQFSFELYADTAIASIRQSATQEFLQAKDGAIDIQKAVEYVNDSTVTFHFQRTYPGQLYDAGLPIVPFHIYSKIPRAELREHPINQLPLSAGPLKLSSWEPMQQVVLTANESSVLPHPAGIERFIYRILPDYRMRIQQLKSGEVDVVPFIRVEDAMDLQRNSPGVAIASLGERFYDAVNWNNIDPGAYASSGGTRIEPHQLFGSAKIRNALTHAINRSEIVESYLAPYARVANGPISPLFKQAYDWNIQSLAYDPKLSERLLAEEGWVDRDGDGILDKNGRKFSFSLRITAGDQFRATLASVIQHALKGIRIEVRIEQLERSAFWGDLMEKKYDACIAGFSMPLQLQLYEFWGSDLTLAPLNLVSYRNYRIDKILQDARRATDEESFVDEWKEFQSILQRDQPCTFLYWMNDLVAYNRRIQNAEIGAMGLMYHAAGWGLDGSSAASAKSH